MKAPAKKTSGLSLSPEVFRYHLKSMTNAAAGHVVIAEILRHHLLPALCSAVTMCFHPRNRLFPSRLFPILRNWLFPSRLFPVLRNYPRLPCRRLWLWCRLLPDTHAHNLPAWWPEYPLLPV